MDGQTEAQNRLGRITIEKFFKPTYGISIHNDFFKFVAKRIVLVISKKYEPIKCNVGTS